MKEAQDRKKSYVDNQRRPLEFMVGDQVFLKVPLVKILWRSSQIKKETWERESEMRNKYLELFSQTSINVNFEDEIFIKSGEWKPLNRIYTNSKNSIMLNE